MNDLKEQFLGFYNTYFLFEQNTEGIDFFEFDAIDLSKIDFSKLKIEEKMPLGKRAEYFFQFYCEHSFRYNIIKHNIQIIHEKETLGELDFIIEDKIENKIIHVEMVYKFYLYDNRFDKELDKYIGPNRDDNLVKKIKKLKNKQFPLLYKTPTKNYLNEININNMIQRSCLFTNIFLPIKLYKKSLPLINNSCIDGFYISYNEFKTYTHNKNSYFMPHRFDWLRDVQTDVLWVNYNEILKEVEFFLDLKKSPLIWMKKNDESFEKLFVTWWD